MSLNVFILCGGLFNHFQIIIQKLQNYMCLSHCSWFYRYNYPNSYVNSILFLGQARTDGERVQRGVFQSRPVPGARLQPDRLQLHPRGPAPLHRPRHAPHPLQHGRAPAHPQVIFPAAKVPTHQEKVGRQEHGRVPAATRAEQRGRAQVAGEGQGAHARDRGAGQDPGARKRAAAEEVRAAAGGAVGAAVVVQQRGRAARPRAPRLGQAPRQLPGPARRHQQLLKGSLQMSAALKDQHTTAASSREHEFRT